MPRRKSMSSIDAEISALKDKISATKTRYENLCRDLEKLQQEGKWYWPRTWSEHCARAEKPTTNL